MGVTKRRSVYGTSRANLAQKVKQLLASPTAPRNAQTLTVGTFLAETYLPAARVRVKPTTYESYEIACRVHIIPHIGKARLKTLSPSNASAWLSTLDSGSRARQNAYKVLKQAMTYAVDLDLIAKNPLSRIKTPPAPRKEPRVLSLAEVRKLLKAAEGSPSFVLIFTAVATSMRTSELFGLRWSDVDFQRGYLRVRQQVVKTNEGLTFGDLKTATAKRRIDLPANLLRVLAQHRKTQGSNPLDLVFTSPNGGFMQKDNFAKRTWAPLLTKAKLPHVTFYSLRHSGNSLLISSGHSIKLAQIRMGHKDPKITLQTYAFLGEDEGRKGAQLLGSLLGSGDNSGDNSPRKRSPAKAVRAVKAR